MGETVCRRIDGRDQARERIAPEPPESPLASAGPSGPRRPSSSPPLYLHLITVKYYALLHRNGEVSPVEREDALRQLGKAAVVRLASPAASPTPRFSLSLSLRVY